MIAKIIFTFFTFIFITGCITTKGNIAYSYMPTWQDDEKINSAHTIALTNGFKWLIEGHELYIGGTSKTYMIFDMVNYDYWTFKALRQEYDVFLNVEKSNYTFFINHRCSHPIEGVSQKLEGKYVVNFDYWTEIGIKYSW